MSWERDWNWSARLRGLAYRWADAGAAPWDTTLRAGAKEGKSWLSLLPDFSDAFRPVGNLTLRFQRELTYELKEEKFPSDAEANKRLRMRTLRGPRCV